jgi:hypothetical protein
MSMTTTQAFFWGTGAGGYSTNEGALGNGVANITFTGYFATADCDEIALLVAPTFGDATSLVLAVQWNESTSAGAMSTTPIWDSSVTTSFAGTDNTVTSYRNLWNMPSTQLPFNILLPVSSSFMRVGAYSAGAPNAATLLQVFLTRQRTYGTQR